MKRLDYIDNLRAYVFCWLFGDIVYLDYPISTYIRFM